MPTEYLELVADLGGIGAEQVAGVGVLRDQAQRLAPVCAVIAVMPGPRTRVSSASW